MFKRMYKGFWKFFKDSGTILMNRMEVVGGFAVGALMGVDWPHLLAMDWSQGFTTGPMIVSGLLVTRGVLGEIVRRRGATDLV